MEQNESVAATNPEPPKSLKILAIGNSFSVDTMWHLYTVARAEGVEEIVLGNLFVGSCTLQMHADYAENDKAVYRYYKNTTGTWGSVEGKTLRYALQDEQWDIITMQQGSSLSGIPKSYSPYLDTLVSYVRENMSNPDCKLYWNMTWAYQNDSTHQSFPMYGNDQQFMFGCIAGAVEEHIEPSGYFAGILPAGTAIQNARTGFVGDTLTRDGHHLSEFGRLLTSYTWYAGLTGNRLYTINLTQFAGKTLTEDEKMLIINSINAAFDDPYSITTQQESSK